MDAFAEAPPRSDVRTGLYTKSRKGLKVRDARITGLVVRMRTNMPWTQASDVPTCRAWAELEALATRVYAELRDKGVINKNGDARRLLDDYRKLRATQIVLSRELGMTPAARMATNASSASAALDIVGQMAQQRLTKLDDAPAENVEPEPEAPRETASESSGGSEPSGDRR